jgi:hypothetical protein
MKFSVELEAVPSGSYFRNGVLCFRNIPGVAETLRNIGIFRFLICGGKAELDERDPQFLSDFDEPIDVILFVARRTEPENLAFITWWREVCESNPRTQGVPIVLWTTETQAVDDDCRYALVIRGSRTIPELIRAFEKLHASEVIRQS